ncbi:MAG TPA: prolyl oligopeptidase family serine peptidase [Duganella sp.]|uniref:alpha/beta hydrolase family protein n=1 Tax=Duganella sp. TaxID=1904440 RepID=UPI002ED05495
MRRHRHLRPVLLLCIAALSPFAGAADTAVEPPAVASFFQRSQIKLVTLSPKGGYVAMATMLPDGTQALVIRNTADLKQVKVVSRVEPETGVFYAIHWINENRVGFTLKNMRLAFETNLDEFAIDRDGANHRHLINGNWAHQQTQTGSMLTSRVLTAAYAFHGTVNDGSDDILVKKFRWNNVDVGPASSRLYRLNTRTLQLNGTFEGTQPEASDQWITDANGVPRVVLSELKGRCIASYRQPDATAWTEIDNGVCFENRRFAPLFFDGTDTLYVKAVHKGYAALFRYDLKTMTMDKEPTVETQGYDFNGTPEIDYPSKRLIGIHLETDADTTVWFNARMKADQAKIDAALPDAINTVRCGANCLDSPVLLIESASDRQPPQYVLYTRATGAVIGLGSIHPDLKPAQMGPRTFHHYTARDGRAIPAYVTMPAGQASGPRPAVVLVHGGPYVRGASWEWDQEAAFLASRGYVVIQPEFRGSTGFGVAHFEAGWKQWGGTMQDDLADAALWAVKQGWADPQRIGIMGASYGGYATLMGLIKDPKIFRAGVEWAGVTDIKLMFTSSESDASQEDLGYSMRTLIGDPDAEADAAMFLRNSPLLRAAELKQPLLMAHGAADRRVPIAHASRFRDAVKAHNPNVTSIVYNDEGHGWRNEQTNIAFWQQVEAFLDKHLKNAQ